MLIIKVCHCNVLFTTQNLTDFGINKVDLRADSNDSSPMYIQRLLLGSNQCEQSSEIGAIILNTI